MTKRQPKGQTNGGEFASDKNPEATAALDGPLEQQAIIEFLHKTFDRDDDADYPGEFNYADTLEPNDEGVNLINSASITTTGQMMTRNGVAWTAILKLGNVSVGVENQGNGGCNSYDSYRIADEMTERVRHGFPNAGSEVLDSFCEVLEVLKEMRK
jgi:hypothetical protein